MSTALSDRFRLFSVAEVAALFPANGSAAKHQKMVEDLIRTHGSYRSFGDTILLTEADVASLLKGIAVKGAEAPQPASSDPGHIVFIGSRTDITEEVFVDWCRPGDVSECVARVRHVVPDVDILEYAAASYGEYLEWTEGQAANRSMGKWFLRTKSFNHAMNRIFPVEDNDNE